MSTGAEAPIASVSSAVTAGSKASSGLSRSRTCNREAMRLLGGQFVLGTDIDDAMGNAKPAEEKGAKSEEDLPLEQGSPFAFPVEAAKKK